MVASTTCSAMFFSIPVFSEISATNSAFVISYTYLIIWFSIRGAKIVLRMTLQKEYLPLKILA
jgi:hypothetical protein